MTPFPPPLRVRPKKSLGQNFLRDDNIGRKIVAAVAPAARDVLLEIGPGGGALSRHLAGRVRALVLVEIDDRVVTGLRERFTDPSVAIIHGDVLDLDLTGLARRYGQKLRIAGNLPYNITSPILFHVLEHRAAVRDLTVMMQREVARRLTARPGTKEYGILSVLCGMEADVKHLFDVSSGAFHPRPAVTSSVVRLTMLTRSRCRVRDREAFRAMVRGVFGKRRKTLRNSLRYYLGEEPLPDLLPVDLLRRPEELTLQELADLANALPERRAPAGSPPR
ncbi:MAG: 16S rRNA (adenine(1518)-N(6)/adenine(1519)-N(6))-dimethyltransferase RsmA [Bacteroidota bacterium]